MAELKLKIKIGDKTLSIRIIGQVAVIKRKIGDKTETVTINNTKLIKQLENIIDSYNL